MLRIQQRTSTNIFNNIKYNIRMNSNQVSQDCPCPPHTTSDSSPKTLNQNEITEQLEKLDNYKFRNNSIERLYTFKGFRGSVKFINQVSDICIKYNVNTTS